MNALAFFEKALWLNYFSILVAFFVGIIRLKIIDEDQRLLLILIGLVLLVEIGGRILWTLSASNLFLYHFYSVAEFLLLATIYTRHLNGLIRPVYMRGLMVAFVLFAISNTLFFQSLRQFNSHVIFTECLLLITLSILFFYKELRDLQHRHLSRLPIFWINTSVITYFSGALVLFYVANDLIPVPLKEQGAIWGVHALFNIVHYALYAVALWVKGERSKELRMHHKRTIT